MYHGATPTQPIGRIPRWGLFVCLGFGVAQLARACTILGRALQVWHVCSQPKYIQHVRELLRVEYDTY
jgi:hypothetical protein